LNYIQENNREKKLNSSLSEKLKKLEEEVKRKNEYLEKNTIIIQNLQKKLELCEKDVLELIVEKMVNQVEKECNLIGLSGLNDFNDLHDESRLMDVTQYIVNYFLKVFIYKNPFLGN
jgi:hypothetical protein